MQCSKRNKLYVANTHLLVQKIKTNVQIISKSNSRERGLKWENTLYLSYEKLLN